MIVIIIASQSNADVLPLGARFREAGFNVWKKPFGNGDWPDFDEEPLVGVVLLDDECSKTVEELLDVKAKTRGLGIPILVIPKVLDSSSQAKLASAGASQVCNPDDTAERIVAEIQCAIEIDKDDDAMSTQPKIMQPFLAATIEAMQVLGGISVKATKVYRKTGYTMQGDISGLICLLGRSEWTLVVTFSMDSAKWLADKVLAGAIENPGQEVLADCVAELTNIIAGQVKGRYVHTENEFDISTPSIVTGANHEIRHREDLPCYVMTFESAVGNFSLQLCVRGKSNERGN